MYNMDRLKGFLTTCPKTCPKYNKNKKVTILTNLTKNIYI